MKLISWNVNGIRAVLKKGFLDFVKKFAPDVLCLQEIKAPGKEFSLNIEGYNEYWNNAKKPGYAGVCVLTKTKPIEVQKGMGIPKHDDEGRLITLEFPQFYLINVYVPNSQRELERLPYRTKEWDVDFLKHLKNVEKKKPVIFCGDMNVAHKEIDLTYPEANVKNHGFTPQEREGFDRIMKAGFIDTFREFHKEGGHYTWWSQMNNCRKRNIGWRIDYFCISQQLRAKLKDSFILKEVLGSDHCPVGVILQ